MKKNNKGFTLAELLIVIAIIAILIAIAIPVFAGQLDNAKLQTDHANIRSAYAMAQVANLEGGIYLGDSTTMTTPPATAGTTTYYFKTDGSVNTDTAGGDNYVLKATGDQKKCASSAACMKDGTYDGKHNAGGNIKIVCEATGTSTISMTWKVVLG